MRARGLKQFAFTLSRNGLLSRPMRARGLKQGIPPEKPDLLVSRPMRARGLKLRPLPPLRRLPGRAPCGRVD